YKCLDKAFKEWESISTLEFKYLYSMNADILIYFVDLNHNIHTGDHNFPSTRVLAHAFYPIYDSNNKMLKHSGDIHFNNEVKDWSLSINNGTSLYLTALHEIGHSLGLNHIMDEKSIMFPYYISRTDNFKLIDTIIDGVIIREKYSKIPVTGIPTTEIPTTINSITEIPEIST